MTPAEHAAFIEAADNEELRDNDGAFRPSSSY